MTLITPTKAPERATVAPAGAGRATGARRFAVPLVITALVVAGAVAGGGALADPVTGDAVSGAGLDVGWLYAALAPVTNVMDTLSLLTLGQHYAVLTSLMLVYMAWRIVRPRSPVGRWRRLAIEAGTAFLALACLLAFYGYGMVGPRPMAALVVDDPAVLVVDMHSHTGESHDVRDSFTADSNREWHDAGGFHAAYVSDHRTWRGAVDGVEGNPARAGGGVVLLPAIELKYETYYASILGDAWRYRHAMKGNDLVPAPLYRGRAERPEPTLVLTLPESLDDVPAQTADSVGFVAVEINDASPRGLRQSRRDRARIIALADSLDLALVAASNNHGWGRTVAAWTLVRIPGWRSLTPQRLGQAIERKVHGERREATVVVERRMPYAGESPAALAGTLPAITWQMFAGIGAAERASWLAWTWALTFLGVVVRSRRPTPTVAREPASVL